MQTTMITDENFRLKGFNIIVSEVEFLILSIALSRMADGKSVNDKDRAIAERMHNDYQEPYCEIADTPQKDCPKMTEEEFDTMLAKVLVGQTESTGSPIGDHRDGVGAWQTERSE